MIVLNNRDRENRDGNYRRINSYKKNIKYKDKHVNPFHDLKCGGMLKKSLKFKKCPENKEEYLCNTLISPPSQLKHKNMLQFTKHILLVLNNTNIFKILVLLHFISNQTKQYRKQSIKHRKPIKTQIAMNQTAGGQNKRWNL